MIKNVETFFRDMMDASNIKAQREHSDKTFEHRFLIRQLNVINMMVDRVITARQASGLPDVGSMKIRQIIQTKVWTKVYSITNVTTKFQKYFGKTSKVFVKPGAGSDVEVIYMKGKYAEVHITADGNPVPKTNMAMADLWREAMSVIKTECARVHDSGNTDMMGDQVPESFSSPAHAGARLHGNTQMKSGFQTTIAKQVLAEGGGEGVGYDDAVNNFKETFLDEYPGDGWLMDQAVSQIFNPIKKKYSVKDVQDYSSASGVREISVTVEYGDNAKNKEMNWADVPGIKAAAARESMNFLRYLNTSIAQLEELPALKGSDSFQTKAIKIAQGRLVEEFLKIKGTRPDFRLKVNKKLLAAAKKAKGKKSNVGGFDLGEVVKTAILTQSKSRSKKVNNKKKGRKNSNKRGVSRTVDSPIALRNLMNEALPQMVASKMTPPALQFRTGRFANSARVENLNIGPKGGLHIDYTYQRAPYETFEPGGKQGSTQRDPRKIIGASIRELAMGILGRQPTTLRRN